MKERYEFLKRRIDSVDCGSDEGEISDSSGSYLTTLRGQMLSDEVTPLLPEQKVKLERQLALYRSLGDIGMSLGKGAEAIKDDFRKVACPACDAVHWRGTAPITCMMCGASY